jgi:hypothetical protein
MASPRETCTRGHLMVETRKFHPNGDSYCSACKTQRTITWRKTEVGKEKSKVYCRTSNLRGKYNLEPGEFEQMLEQQLGTCAICDKTLGALGRSLNIDHDHKTGLVRGLLCHNCNMTLGLVADDINILYKMINYLKKKPAK